MPHVPRTVAPQVQLAFWGASLPVCLVAYGLASGHWPDLSDQEDVAKFSAEAFAYVNVARLAAPLRVGAYVKSKACMAGQSGPSG